ncbi:MAG: Gfo/Idh/MocA family oxidoreductase [Propionibacteriaceae bacterium]|nr:Gfo/Idh/MocA family oxidoreductase [Propionibacteriaceae bacterium]
MSITPLSFHFVGHCSHTDLFSEFLTRTGTGRVTDDPTEADAVCVFERDAALHAALAQPHLDAGRPVFVEKPMALDVSTARRLCSSVGPVTSFSTLRWAPGLSSLQGATRLTVTGPARPGDPAGWAFYGVHAVEIAQQILGGAPGPASTDAGPDGVRVRYALGDVPVELDLAPHHGHWQVTGVMDDGTTRIVDVEAGPGYFEPACREILDFARTGVSPVPVADMVGVVAVVEALASR